jgi:plastocyanin
MRRGGSLALVAVMPVAGLAAGIFAAGGGASSEGSRAASHSMATTHVTVTATDSKFRLSKRSVPIGTVVFTVTNKGKISHDFKIAGKKTPLLSPRHSARLRVTFSTKGRYPYLSTVSGQAAHGMEGRVLGRSRAPHNRPGARSHHHNHSVHPADRAGRYGQHDGHRRDVRRGPAGLHLPILSADDAVGHGHIRDHEQVRRFVQLRPRGHQGG